MTKPALSFDEKLKLVKEKRNNILTEYNSLKRNKVSTPKLGKLKLELKRLDKRIREFQYALLMLRTNMKESPKYFASNYINKEK